MPNWLFTAATIFCVVSKSISRSSICIVPPACVTAFGTARSTIAPPEMRPTASWFTCTLLPFALAPAPPTTRLPCAIA